MKYPEIEKPWLDAISFRGDGSPRVGRADTVQCGGDHYKSMAVQPWTALESWLTHEQLVGYHLGQAIAYLARFNAQAPGKGGRDDLLKAQHYMDKLLETVSE